MPRALEIGQMLLVFSKTKSKIPLEKPRYRVDSINVLALIKFILALQGKKQLPQNAKLSSGRILTKKIKFKQKTKVSYLFFSVQVNLTLVLTQFSSFPTPKDY